MLPFPFPFPPMVPGLVFAPCPQCHGWFPVHPDRQPVLYADPLTGVLHQEVPADPAVQDRAVPMAVCPLCQGRIDRARADAGLPPLPERT